MGLVFDECVRSSGCSNNAAASSVGETLEAAVVREEEGQLVRTDYDNCTHEEPLRKGRGS